MTDIEFKFGQVYNLKVSDDKSVQIHGFVVGDMGNRGDFIKDEGSSWRET